MQTEGLDEIQRQLGYRFQRSSLLIEALTHKSYLNEAKEAGRVDNERLEAVLAGVYLDGGLDAAAASVKAAFSEELASCDRSLLATGDFKTDLQEVCQREFEMLPHYRTTRETGPDHEKLFEVEILIRG